MNIKKLKLWKKIVLGLLLFIILILFLAPRIANRYIVNNSTEIIGRTLEIEKIRLNYFSGALKIKNLTLYEEDESTAFLSFEKLKVNLDYWPLFRKELRISEISFNELYSKIDQRGEWFNFSDLIEPSDSAKKEQEIEADTVKEKMALTINNINLVNCHIQYSDLLLKHVITLNDIDLHIPGFTLNSGSTNLAIDFDFEEGGRFYSELQFNQVESTYALHLQLDSLNLDIIEPYIKNSLDISEINGYFTNNIDLRGNLEHISQAHMSGWNQIDSLQILDQQDRSILSFKQFKLVLDTLLLDDYQIQIDEISLIEPYILFELIDSTNNWQAMMITDDSLAHDSVSKDTVSNSGKNDFDISLTRLALQKGEIVFFDKTLTQEFKSQIHNLNISSKDLGTSMSSVQINISAEINQTAKILSDFVINPQKMDELEVEFELQDFVMKDIEPYLQHYFGYPVKEGLLNFSTKNELSGKSLISQNNLLVRKFELGKPDKENAKIRLPLRLALGILSDKDGIIDLDIPVESSGEETSIKNLGKLILKTIGNLFVKAATAPVELLSNLFNADPEKLKEIKLGMFDTRPGEDGLESLDLIAQILKEKPKLRVNLIHDLDREKYYDSLSYLIAVESFIQKQKETEYKNLNPVPDSLLEKFLYKEMSGKEIPENSSLKNLYSKYSANIDLAAKYDSLRTQQLDFISDYLVDNKGVPSNRVGYSFEVPDSLQTSANNTLFHILFKSADSGK